MLCFTLIFFSSNSRYKARKKSSLSSNSESLRGADEQWIAKLVDGLNDATGLIEVCTIDPIKSSLSPYYFQSKLRGATEAIEHAFDFLSVDTESTQDTQALKNSCREIYRKLDARSAQIATTQRILAALHLRDDVALESIAKKHDLLGVEQLKKKISEVGIFPGRESNDHQLILEAEVTQDLASVA